MLPWVKTSEITKKPKSKAGEQRQGVPISFAYAIQWWVAQHVTHIPLWMNICPSSTVVGIFTCTMNRACRLKCTTYFLSADLIPLPDGTPRRAKVPWPGKLSIYWMVHLLNCPFHTGTLTILFRKLFHFIPENYPFYTSKMIHLIPGIVHLYRTIDLL